MAYARVSCFLCTVSLLGLTNLCNAGTLVVTEGITYLGAGSYTYDYVSITGGALYLNGDVTITCNGDGSGYFSLGSAGYIRNQTTYPQNQTSDGAALSGNDGANGSNGEAGGNFAADNGPSGYSLTVYADANITLHGHILLPGSEGRPHYNNSLSYSGHGGRGGDGTPDMSDFGWGGAGGTGGSGGESQGGHGGDAGSVFFETQTGTIDAGQTSGSHADIQLLGGDGGLGGRGGNGGMGGHGGDCGEYGMPGPGGNGGNGGNSNGGDGGDGGGITLRAATIYDDYISYTLTKGDGANGGVAGSAGSFNYGGNDGNNTYGGDGANGSAGSLVTGSGGEAGSYSTQVIPEPSSVCLLFAGLASVAMAFRKRR